jgi:hypothetical protein
MTDIFTNKIIIISDFKKIPKEQMKHINKLQNILYQDMELDDVMLYRISSFIKKIISETKQLPYQEIIMSELKSHNSLIQRPK